MKTRPSLAEGNIHLRVRALDKSLIDHAAELTVTNRSQFMLSSALKEAKNVLLAQTTIYADNRAFQKVLDWMEKPPTKAEVAGMKRLKRSSLA